MTDSNKWRSAFFGSWCNAAVRPALRSLSVFVLSATLLPGMFASVELDCHNEAEISCTDESCRVADQFTPMQIGYTARQLRICAYSGCWVGKPVSTTSGSHLHVSAHAMRWEGTGTNPTDALLSIDLNGTVGVLRVASFALPIRCKVTRTGHH